VKRVLVTGAAGFVGANLARRLVSEGHATHLVVHRASETWRLVGVEAEVSVVDLADAEDVDGLVARVRPDWIFHLAAHGAYSWQTDMRRIVAANVTGAANLLQAALDVGCEALVNAGSSSEYGLKTGAPDEHEAVDPNSVYAATKAAATMLFRHAAIARGMPITTLRLYSAYGPWEDPRRLIPALVRSGLEGRLPPLVDAATARDFVYVGDVVDAFVLAASTDVPAGSVFNIATGVQTTLADAVAVARRVLEIDEEPRFGSLPARAWDSPTWVGDASRARAELGWSPSHSFEGGFEATVEWARSEGWPPGLPSA